MLGAVAKAVVDALAADPDRPVVSGEAELSAGGLLAGSAGFANALKAHGCGQDSRVVLYLQSNVDLLAGLIGSWMVGACVLMMDFRTPGTQRSAVARRIGATLSVEGRRMPKTPDDYPWVPFDETWRRPAPWMDFAAVVNPQNSFALCALSSGTTGSPKIYLQSHAMVMGRMGHGIEPLRWPEDLLLAPMSLSISATRVRVLNYLIGGGRIHFTPPMASAGELIETLSATRASGTALPPSIIATMVRAIGVRPQPYFPHLRTLRSTGGPALPEDKIAAYRYLTRGYRMAYSSNLTGTVTMLSGEDVLKRPETVGRPISGVRVEIVDTATGRRLPGRQAGLIKVITPNISDETIEPADAPPGGREQRGADWGIAGHRHPRRRRLPDDRRPGRGHDHPWRRQRRAAGDRGRPRAAPRGDGGRRGRDRPCDLRPGDRRRDRVQRRRRAGDPRLLHQQPRPRKATAHHPDRQESAIQCRRQADALGGGGDVLRRRLRRPLRAGCAARASRSAGRRSGGRRARP
nr:class I adenylate-forming enzyme family protein [Aquibium microcysteis]